MSPAFGKDNRRRSVLCRKHGLHYDPDLHTGCLRCRKEQAAARASRRGSSGLIAAVIGLIVLVGAVAAWRGGILQKLGGAETTGATGGISPSPYRAEITALETALYRDATSEELGPRIAAAATALATSLRRADPDQRLRDAADRVAAFADQVARTGQIDVPAWRRSWEALRGELFVPNPWFRAPGSGRPAGEGADGSRDAELVLGLGGVSGQLDQLITVARKAVAALGEEPDAARISAWQAFATGWPAQLEPVAAKLAPVPAEGVDPGIVLSHQELETALQELTALTQVADDGAAPGRVELQRRLDAASASLAEARRYLEEIKIAPTS